MVAGDDTFKSSNAGGNDTFTGGAQVNGDTVDYSAVTGGGVNVNLGGGSATDIGGSGVGTDTLNDVENAIGTAQADILTGSAGANVLTGNGGNDTLEGGDGSDTLIGGADTDTAAYTGILSSAATFAVDVDGHWTVTIGGSTDDLIGIERVTFADKTFLLVDKEGVNVGGYQTVQSAIDASTGGETILIRGGRPIARPPRALAAGSRRASTSTRPALRSKAPRRAARSSPRPRPRSHRADHRIGGAEPVRRQPLG